MKILWGRFLRRIRRALAPIAESIIVGFVRVLVWWSRLFPISWSSAVVSTLARLLGPFFLVSRVARDNLRRAFPHKSDAEIRRILDGVWDNLGRMSAEFAHLDRIWDYDPVHPGNGRIEIVGTEVMARLRDDGKPALFFTSHTGNWELNAITGGKLGVKGGVLYRAPNIKKAAKLIEDMRAETMPGLIRANRNAGRQMARMLEEGQHIGMLVDQYWGQGVSVDFFGRPCPTNPTLARLARQFECPVHGMRVIRLPKGRFRIEITEEVILPRDADGRIDVQGAMQAVTDVIEDWVREYPGQWLWLHRRWR
ncbi:lipid A biosynthesis lauroyl acyltransferase [Roseixanthobacter psychrophilus]|uniref:lipid A biosynthesis lauroyl acyltransferase n=1 Tax=Roseixanthobacter psychrophilus TaxID=3119917 RepID=UPI003D1E2D35